MDNKIVGHEWKQEGREETGNNPGERHRWDGSQAGWPQWKWSFSQFLSKLELKRLVEKVREREEG